MYVQDVTSSDGRACTGSEEPATLEGLRETIAALMHAGTSKAEIFASVFKAMFSNAKVCKAEQDKNFSLHVMLKNK